MAINNNTLAAVNIINGHGASTQIAGAAENYEAGDYLRAGADLVGALDALASMGGSSGFPPATALQATAIANTLRLELQRDGNITDSTIQDIVALSLGPLAAAAAIAGAPVAAVAAITVSVAFGAYTLIRADGTTYIFDDMVEIYDDLFGTGPSLVAPDLSDYSPLSPLALDLDQDGVETTSIDNGAYFDFDGNDFRQQTSWLSGDDALLVLDLNQDGVINSGQELFGTDTVLQNGELASNGFEALAEYDLNNDGVINNQDSIFSDLQLWQDTNEDGLTDAGELHTLEEMNVESIGLTYVDSSLIDENDVEHRQQGTFSFTNNDVEQSIHDLWFQDDKRYSIPVVTQEDDIPTPFDILILPDIQGFGNVYSLQQAMARDVTGALQTLVEDYVIETDRTARQGMVKDIILTWTGQDPENTERRGAVDSNVVGALEALWGTDALFVNPAGRYAGNVLDTFDEFSESVFNHLERQTYLAPLFHQVIFTEETISLGWGQTETYWTADVSQVTTTLVNMIVESPDESSEMLYGFMDAFAATDLHVSSYGNFYESLVSEVSSLEFGSIEEGEAVFEVIFNYDNYMSGTLDVGDINSNDILRGYDGNDILNAYAGEDVLHGDNGDDVLNAGSGVDLLTGGTGDDTLNGGDDNDYLMGGSGNDRLEAGDGNDYLLGGEGEDILIAGTGNDVLRGHGGNDSLIGEGGEDKLDGGEGNDLLDGGSGNDYLTSGAGDDRVFGEGGDDVIDAGTGNDFISTGYGADVVHYNLGDGLDTFEAFDVYVVEDRIVFGEGITIDDLSFNTQATGNVITTTDNSLLLNIGDTGEGINFIHWFNQQAQSFETALTLEFSDGSEVTLQALLDQYEVHNIADGRDINYAGANNNDVIDGTDSNDALYGMQGDDVLNGGNGFDSLNGGSGDDTLNSGAGGGELHGWFGNDTLNGGSGDESIYGESGEDLIDGAGGNDLLYGMAGSDTYIFGRGYGHDVISEDASETYEGYYTTIPDNTDIVRFTPDITIDDLEFTREGNQLVVRITDSPDDSLTMWGGQENIEQWKWNDSASGYDRGNWVVERFEFADGNYINTSIFQDLANIQHGDELSNDQFSLYANNNRIIYGHGGDDIFTAITGSGSYNYTLFGGAGNDTLGATAGNDLLYGGVDNDNYILGATGGVDIIYDESGTSDSIQFNTSVASTDVQYLTQGGNDLQIVFNADNRIFIQDWFAGNEIETLQFNDIAVTAAEVNVQVITQTNTAPIVTNAIADQSVSTLVRYGDSYAEFYEFDLPENTFSDVDNFGVLNISAELSDGSPLPIWLTYDAGLNRFTGMPKADDLGDFDIRVIATDSEGLETSDVFRLTVTGGENGTPTINIVPGSDLGETLNGTTGRDEIYGYGGDDTLNGLGGDFDTLYGGEGNDTLNGGDQRDYLYGGSGADTLSGGRGGDWYYVDNIDDVIIEDENIGDSRDEVFSTVSYTLSDNLERLYLEGDESLTGNGNNQANFIVANDAGNTLYGHGGDDDLSGGMGSDAIYGGSGNDFISTGGVRNGSVVNYLYGEAGEDNLRGSVGIDFLMGGDDIDRLWGEDGNDYLEGGKGNDTLEGGNGDDTFRFNLGDGQDTLTGGYDATDYDVLEFGTSISSDDLIFNQNNDDLIISIQGSTDQITITGWYAVPYIENERLAEIRFLNGDDPIVFGLNNGETIFDNSGINNFTGTLNNDAIVGLEGDDTIFGGDGEDALNGNNGNDTLNGGNQNDVLYGHDGTDVLNGDAGDDLLNGGQGIDTLNGGQGDDTIIGGSGNDVLNGDAGNDTLVGGDGNDILDGGTGINTLTGGEGNDTYLYSDITNNIVINDFDSADQLNSAHTDVLVINDASVLEAGLDFSRVNEDLIISITGQAGTVTITDWFNDTGYELSSIQLYDRSEINLVAAIQQAHTQTGTIVNDTLVGLSVDDTLIGLDGHDALFGNDGNDTLLGGSGVDVLEGGSGNDNLDGGLGNDLLVGGENDDTYTVDNQEDIVFELTDEGIDEVESSVSFSLSENVENITLVGEDNINATGNNLNNIVTGNAGDNTLDGGQGVDTLQGGLGNDTYIVDSFGDLVVEGFDEGIDQVNSSIEYALNDDVENLLLTGLDNINATGNDFSNIITGNVGNNILTGGLGNDTLDGGAGTDQMIGGQGDDTYFIDNATDVVTENFDEGNDSINSSIDYTLTDNIENLTLIGSGNIAATGNALDNIITGNSADNILSGNGGFDTLIGGSGNDTYLIDADGSYTYVSDTEGVDVIEFGAGINASDIEATLSFGADLNLRINRPVGEPWGGQFVIEGWYNGNQIERFVFSGGYELTGQEIVAPRYSTSFNEMLGKYDLTISGPGGILTSLGGSDDGVIYGTEGDDIVKGGGILNALGGNDRVIGSAQDDIIFGGSGDDFIIADYGNDLIDGGLGADAMYGGAGDDTYIVDDIGDVVTELGNQGTDTVNSSISYTLSDNVENLTLTGAAAINGTGNAQSNIITGNDANNNLEGLDGDDTLIAGGGNDWLRGGDGNDYLIGGDALSPNAWSGNFMYGGAGNDVLDGGTKSYNSLSGGAGNDTINAGSGSRYNNMQGGADNDVLNGSSGNDILNGGTGDDYMAGGAGNDTYYLDSLLDVMVENANEGIDTVVSTIDYALADDFENVILTGTSAINATGNATDNMLSGNNNSAANILTGGLGNDTYNISTGDTVVENANEGTDTVKANLTYTLGNNVENLTLTGNAAINGTGNSLDNILAGNFAANVLNGGAGADTMSGRYGNDTYIVDDIGDVVTELGNQGTDTVNSSISYTLSDNVENLTLTGAGNISGYGNALNNVISGNTGNNIIDAGKGNDVVIGGSGDDQYLFNLGDGNDQLADASGNDEVVFGSLISANQLWFEQEGNDLNISVIGTDDSINVVNWYADDLNHIESLQAESNLSLSHTQVDQMVSAMAAFGVTDPSQFVPTAEQQTQLDQIVSVNWQVA